MAAGDRVDVAGHDPVEQNLPTWATYLIVSAALGAVIAVLNEGSRLGAVGVFVVAAGFLAAARRWPGFFSTAWQGPVSVAAVFLVTLMTGDPSHPLRRYLLLVLITAAATQPPRRILVTGVLALAARGGLMAIAGFNDESVTTIAIELALWLGATPAIYMLRTSLASTARDLARSEALHRSLFAGYRSAIFVLDPDGTVLETNQAGVEIAGRSEDEIIGADFTQFVDQSALPDALVQLERAMNGEVVTYDTVAVRADGTRVPLTVTNFVVPVPDGGQLIYGIAADASEKTRERHAREAFQRRFRHLADTAKDGIYVVRTDDGRHFEYVNQALVDMTGVPREEWFADATVARRYIHPEDVERIDADYPVGEPWPEPVVLRWSHPDGDLRWFEVREVPYEDEQGRTIGTQGIMHDITALKRRQEATDAALEREQRAVEHLRRVDDMKNVFLQSVSHELRTPLTSVLGLCETLARHIDRLPTDRTGELLDRTVVNARKLDRLLGDLLDVDRLTRGLLVPNLADVDVAAVAARVVEEDEEMTLDVRIDLQPVTIRADGPKIERIVENLLHNAARHTPEETPVWLRVGPADAGAEIVVEDAGPGIDPDLAEVLFEPFTQGSASAQAAKPGTGIGLSLVAQFAELHGGHASAGDRPGGGARFRVWLPSRPPAEVLAAAQTAVADAPPTGA